jgi:methionyl-tRNA formyltransferase
MLLANGEAGLKVCEFLIRNGDRIACLYLSGSDQSFDEQIKKASCLSDDNIFSSNLLKDQEHINWLNEQNIGMLITVYWPYLLKPEIFNIARKTINFHPALLPVNRGWYPHVHSIIDGTPTGVTLHVIDENADTGPIWIQKEVPLTPYDTAKSIYTRLQEEIINLFIDHWEKIKHDQLKPFHQDNSKAIYHKKNELELLDHIDLNKKYKAKDLINLLRARSFGDRGFAYYIENEKKVFVNIRLNETSSF